ncbi:MAG TPA: hypothetical protein VJQ58_07445 [Burkholderiales bacterium]|nr:hypothetical protein [Burkholderiales bacterium]
MQITQTQRSLQPRITLVFAEVGPGPTVQIGPFPQVWIDGVSLRRERGGEVLAQHHPHSWGVRGRKFFRVDCESPVKLHFEGEKGESSQQWGPFMHFSCADGIAYGDGVIYGNVDLESRLWYGHLDRRYWRWLVVTSAAAPPE